jgi:hypothetical protein
MANNNPEPYLEPVSEGVCEFLNCSSRADYRASWAQGVIIRIVCSAHKAELEGKPFEHLNPGTFRARRRARQE